MSDHAQDPSVTALAPIAAPLIFTFTNGKPHAVRVHTDAQGEPLFHVGDLCDLLEHVNTRQALRTHVEPDDVQKLDVIDRMGRTQSANFVNEAGMWSLLLGSHAPNAKKVKRWVTGEVLPAIRKTGRYVAPHAQPDPAPTPEYLTQAERNTVSYLVGQICQNKRFGGVWSFASWAGLRRVTGTKAPAQFEVGHLQAIATELDRQNRAASALDDLIHAVEAEFLKRVFRHGEEAAIVLEQIQARMTTPALPMAEDFAARRSWLRQKP